MFLKSIEIRGFKSFAEKTDLAFMKGVTSVVGPNGSGKSNISDAVRWVLGEQSVKSLRGGKMEDVIFAGTQYRKPVSLAQVSLTLDNSDVKLPIDYSDVTISRRLYRSGESEYYINNTQCRLRDIQELFMDTGIGKEGYSIIGQGKIDAILSGRPEERRSLLEEAAGIVKYKSRKEEAEKKLSNTEQNLVRISDIIKTFEDRLDPLRIQSEKAKAFLELSNSLTSKEANLIVHSIDGLQNKIDEVNSKIVNIKEEIKNFTETKERKVKALEELNSDFEKHSAEVQKNQQEYYGCKSEYQSINSENSLQEERLKNLAELIDKNLLEINLTQDKISALIQHRSEHENNLSEIQAEQKVIAQKINNCEAEIIELNSVLSENEAFISSLKNENENLARQISDSKSSILLKNSEKQVIEDKISELKLTSENHLNSIKINSSTIFMLENSINDINKNVQLDEEAIKVKRNEIIKLNNIINKEEKLYKELNSGINKMEANHNMLVSLEKQYEGYNKAVKLLMKDISFEKIADVKNRCFVLGDVIEVGKQFEVSVEIALGGSISDVITDDEKIARRLMDYLKANNLGRATFLPLNIIKSKKIQVMDNLKSISGYRGIASELISYNDRFKNAVEFLLGRTIIADNMEAALKIAKASNFSYKIVTLAGEVINSGGSLTGGSIFHKSTNVISRKREIQELEQKLEASKKELGEIGISIEANKLLSKSLDDNILNLRDEIYGQNIEITKLRGEVTSITTENARLSQVLSQASREIEEYSTKLNKLIEYLSNLELSMIKLQQSETENSMAIDHLSETLKDKFKVLSELKDLNTSLKIKKAQIDEKINNKIRELERLSREIDETNDRYKALNEENEASQKAIKLGEASVEENNKKSEGILESILRYEVYFKDSELDKISIKNNINAETNDLNNITAILSKSEENYHRQELLLTKHQAELESLYLKLNEEMTITYAEALKYKAEIENIDTYKKEITLLKNEIAALGLVNVSAIEEYKDVKEKYSFMSLQKEDLMNAKQELINMIDEMTEKMRAVFNENINTLRSLFDETFKELFKGGRADLIIASGDELTSNIEINVEPPGKRLQNINLMSGGEKVLSAIALLFAILKMKPTPFCILDEIEAALDDANVARYAEFLKKFSDNIQFIVITHRKGTMEVSDVLYGVTMEEKGVSKVVSVDLNKNPY